MKLPMVGTLATMLALVSALVFTAPAAAAIPTGNGPDSAIPLETGTVTGTLAPGQVTWYNYWHFATLNDALTLKTNPAIPMKDFVSDDNTGYTGGVYFNVEWKGDPGADHFPGGMFEKDLPGYYRVAQSSQSGLSKGGTVPDGTQYWQQDKSNLANLYQIGIVNQTAMPISFAFTLDRSNDVVTPEDFALPAPAAPPLAAVPAAPPVAVAGVSASVTTGAGSSSPTAAPPLNGAQSIARNGTVTGTLAPGQSTWYSYTHFNTLNDALTLKSTPAIDMTPFMSDDNTGYTSGVFFNVEWTGTAGTADFPGGMFEKDLPGYYRVAQSTQSGLENGGTVPDGTQYWQMDKSSFSTTFQIQVINQTASTISYALTLDQSNDAVSPGDNALPAPTP